MEPTSLVHLHPQSYARWRALPIFGPLLDDFVRWMHDDEGYTLATTTTYLRLVPEVMRWLRRRKLQRLSDVTLQALKAAHRYFRSRHAETSGAVRALERFLRVQGTIAEGQPPPLSPVDVEIDHFATHLRATRGLADKTVVNHTRQLRGFLRFLHLDRSPAQLRRLESGQIEAFLRQSARTNNRFSLQHIIATLRTFLGWRHAQGLLARPLHLEIDTPRVWRGERLPRALPWAQVQMLLQSIDQSQPGGGRDFALLYLAAAYGLRSCELVRLTLDDIDWRGRTLRVRQTKTRQSLHLPLTDEAADVLIGYVRHARPPTAYRELFLRLKAPRSPLQPTAVHGVLVHQMQRSGLNLPPCGTHALRHGFAMRLLRQGIPLKTIGDVLGHRDVESTSVYLRLDVDDLRNVALPVPAAVARVPVTLVSRRRLPRIRSARPGQQLPAQFRSPLAHSLQRYVDLKRALGCRYVSQERVLRHWDHFVRCKHPEARKVCARMFAAWAKTLAPLTSTTSHVYQCIVRQFLLFHARDHRGTFVPDRLSFPKPDPALTPRLITEAEMGRVLEAAGRLAPTPTNPLRAETFRIGLMLLFCCGLRRGELLRLTLGDIEGESGVLQIRMTKFQKTRLVPLSVTVANELKQYLRRRREHELPMTPEAFLLCSGHRSPGVYGAANLGAVWQQLCVSAQVLTARGYPPRLHDLRHSMAVNALQRWYEQGANVHAKLSHLAAYLGHVSAASTHYYLKLTPSLREAASQRFHQRYAPLFTAGGRA